MSLVQITLQVDAQDAARISELSLEVAREEKGLAELRAQTQGLEARAAALQGQIDGAGAEGGRSKAWKSVSRVWCDRGRHAQAQIGRGGMRVLGEGPGVWAGRRAWPSRMRMHARMHTLQAARSSRRPRLPWPRRPRTLLTQRRMRPRRRCRCVGSVAMKRECGDERGAWECGNEREGRARQGGGKAGKEGCSVDVCVYAL